MEWKLDAECRFMDPEMFVPSRDSKGAEAQKVAAAAQVVCRRCPVKAECLEYAMALPAAQCVGIWAGTSDRQRQRMRRGGYVPATPG